MPALRTARGLAREHTNQSLITHQHEEAAQGQRHHRPEGEAGRTDEFEEEGHEKTQSRKSPERQADHRLEDPEYRDHGQTDEVPEHEQRHPRRPDCRAPRGLFTP